MTPRDDRGRSRVVLVAARREVLAASLRAVLEPRGYLCAHAHDLGALERALAVRTPDLIILEEDLAESGGGLGALGRSLGLAEIPVLLYASGAWKPLAADAGTHDRDAAWDVIEEPIRSAALLEKLDRIFELRELWGSTGGDTEHASGLDDIMRGLPILDSIASRSRAEISCVVLGPTKPDGHGDEALSAVPRQIRGSDLYGWTGPSELVVFLYGAGIDGIGEFVSRVAGGSRPGERAALSAGIVTLSPVVRPGEGPSRAQSPSLRVLEHVAAARRALGRARMAGGGVRVAGSP